MWPCRSPAWGTVQWHGGFGFKFAQPPPCGVPGEGIEERVAELLGGRGYSFAYMPPLVTLLALIGPYYGLVSVGLSSGSTGIQFNLFFTLVAIIVVCAWALLLCAGRLQLAALIVLLISIILANMTAVLPLYDRLRRSAPLSSNT